MSQEWQFGPFRLIPRERLLVRDDEPVELREKLFATLVALVERAGRLVEKEELLEAVWPDAVVEESNLAHNVSALRKALGDEGGRYIQTVPKRGYRFVAEVRPIEDRVAATLATGGGERQLDQEIRFAATADGVDIAYARMGEGPPLVKAANWLNHLEFDLESPVWRHWLRALSRGRTLIRYDERGNGLSEWRVDDLSFDAMVSDLEAVVDELQLERFPLLGISQGCAFSIAYAVRHPERVSRLVLYGGYARGWALRSPESAERGRALQSIIRHGWASDNPAYRQMFTSIYVPEASPEQMRWFNDLQRITTSPENACRLMETLGEIDVVDLLPRVEVPTLVVHCRDEVAVPFAEGRLLAARIPGARFLPLDSANHLLLADEPAWHRFVAEIEEFLAGDPSGA